LLKRIPLQSFNINLSEIIETDVTIFWMRRDLRIHDNAALYEALKNNKKVISLFIFDTEILDDLDQDDKRVDFILQSLQIVKQDLEKLKTSLLVLHGNPELVFEKLNPRNVYTNQDYEAYAIHRDEVVKRTLQKKGISFYAFKDHVIFEKDEVVKSDGKPYTVFTPYSRQWKSRLNDFYIKAYPCEKYYTNFLQIKPLPIPTLQEIGFTSSGIDFPERRIQKAIIEKYHNTRNIPGITGTSKLGVHLRFGTLSIRQAVRLALATNEVWLNELIWRDFYSMILWNFPHVEQSSFKPAYDHIPWRNNEEEFDRWCEGKTGYPIVDAGMRELNATGFMHNRVRMITASFLTKHLLIDYRWGEAYFAKKLLDFDLASNNGGWQWAAGSGCDAAPYFRIFNPYLQTEKFDPEKKYIRKWVPEFESAEYPEAIVDHVHARERAIHTYKKALG
jgi:deoxyribodipyrimidine photo-lyase